MKKLERRFKSPLFIYFFLNFNYDPPKYKFISFGDFNVGMNIDYTTLDDDGGLIQYGKGFSFHKSVLQSTLASLVCGQNVYKYTNFTILKNQRYTKFRLIINNFYNLKYKRITGVCYQQAFNNQRYYYFLYRNGADFYNHQLPIDIICRDANYSLESDCLYVENDSNGNSPKCIAYYDRWPNFSRFSNYQKLWVRVFYNNQDDYIDRFGSDATNIFKTRIYIYSNNVN